MTKGYENTFRTSGEENASHEITLQGKETKRKKKKTCGVLRLETIFIILAVFFLYLYVCAGCTRVVCTDV